MENTTRGRYAARRTSRTPILALLLILGLVAVGCMAEVEADEPGYTSTSVDDYDSDTVTDEQTDEEITRLAIAVTFDDASAAELAEVCDALDVLGMDESLAQFAEGWGPSWKDSYEPMVESELRSHC